MSDNLKRYLAIRQALIQRCPTPISGNLLRHLHTLAALISGMVASGRTNLPQLASHLPGGTQRESRIKRFERFERFERFLKNERVCQESFFMPFAGALLARLPAGPLVLVMDTSQVGDGHQPSGARLFGAGGLARVPEARPAPCLDHGQGQQRTLGRPDPSPRAGKAQPVDPTGTGR